MGMSFLFLELVLSWQAFYIMKFMFKLTPWGFRNVYITIMTLNIANNLPFPLAMFAASSFTLHSGLKQADVVTTSLLFLRFHRNVILQH